MRRTWSFDINHWQSLPKKFLEGNWKSVKFVSSSNNLVTKSGGIYMFCVSVPNAFSGKLSTIKTPIYMGISKNLQRRFINHQKKEELIEARKCFGNDMDFMYLKIEPYEEQDIKVFFEQPMIDCFGKVVNKIDSVAQLPSIKGTLGKIEYL